MVYGNKDRSEIMMASAVQSYAHRHVARSGTRAVIFTDNNSAYSVTVDLVAAEIEIAANVHCRETVPEIAWARWEFFQVR